MAAADLREKPLAELDGELVALFREQFNLRMRRGSGQIVSPHDIKRVRRQIARVKTVINQKRSSEHT